jgi:hypothetical protein
MRSRLLAAVVVVPVLFLATACGGTEESPSTSTPAGSDGGDNNAASGGSDGEPTVEIVDHGFGQSECCVQGMVVVTTDSEVAIGESVTVTANFLDADGQILETVEQIESFKWAGQELALPLTPYDLDGKDKVASIDPSVALSDYGMDEEAKAPLPVLEATEIKKGQFSDYTASFAFTNETDANLENLRVGVVCYDAAQKIVGGTSTYPELAPAGKTIRIDADLTVSGKPSSCKAFVNYDVM